MDLVGSKLNELENLELAPDQRALSCCRAAAELIEVGQYESAREALSYLWPGVGERPATEALTILTTAEVLLQCGVLSGWLGSVRQTPGAQEKAQDLISEACRLFESEGRAEKVSEAQYELALCYFRLGAYDEARVILGEAFKALGAGGAELKAKISIRRASVEIWLGRNSEARRVLEETRHLFDDAPDVLRGKWHGQMGLVFRRLGSTEGKDEYFDSAIIEYTAAIYYYEQARHERYAATNQNNLAFLLIKLGRYKDAHEHLKRATRVLLRLKDEGLLAYIKETRARVYVAEGKYQEANGLIGEVIKSLEQGGEENALLADALTTQGVVWAGIGADDHSLKVLKRAVKVALDAGASSNAALALLTLIEEHGSGRLSESELYKAYRSADGLLRDTQDAEELARLRACARIVMARLSGAQLGRGFSLPKAVLAYESKFIEQALEMEEGSVTRAAKRLNLKHQSLAHMLNTRHRHLRGKRTPPTPRRRSIIKKSG